MATKSANLITSRTTSLISRCSWP